MSDPKQESRPVASGMVEKITTSVGIAYAWDYVPGLGLVGRGADEPPHPDRVVPPAPIWPEGVEIIEWREAGEP